MNNEPQKVADHIIKLRKSLGLPDQQTDTENFNPQLHTDKEREYWKKVNSDPVIKPCTQDELMARLRASNYDIDAENKFIVESVVGYFAGRQDCGLDLNKGIAMIGPPGVGKTLLMRLMMHNSSNPFCMANCVTIVNSCEQEGSEGIEQYFRKRITSSPSMYYGNKVIGVCFNELGRERVPVKYYGNPTNVMQEIIFNRYENQIPHRLTHFTSNKKIAEMESRYGDFVRDRMREMFNLVTFHPLCKSRRK